MNRDLNNVVLEAWGLGIFSTLVLQSFIAGSVPGLLVIGGIVLFLATALHYSYTRLRKKD